MLHDFNSGPMRFAFAQWRKRHRTTTYLSSMCVRNAILSAWTTLEMACCDALKIEKLEGEFKESLHAEFDKRNIPRLNFGSDLSQEINVRIKGCRKRFVHSGVKMSDRFPPVSIAEEAISTIRKAIRETPGVVKIVLVNGQTNQEV